MKDKNELIEQLVEQYKYPIVIVDLNHEIKYLNQAARLKYAKRGFNDLKNKSLFNCHNTLTADKIKQYAERMKNGLDEIYLTATKENQKVFMVAIRDQNKELVGYYERFEDIHKNESNY
jgi:hypothetical protein